MTYSNIESAIEELKEVNLVAGEELQRQFLKASSGNGEYTKTELENIILGDEDVADEHYNQDEDKLHADIREIQHSIINFFGE